MKPDDFRPLDGVTYVVTCLFILTALIGLIYAAVTAILS
jgi:hypothetical protein